MTKIKYRKIQEVILSICFALSVAEVVEASPVILYDATLLPEYSGFNVISSTGNPTTVGTISVSLASDGLLNVSTIGGTYGYATNYYYRDTGAGAFVVSMRIAVSESSHDFGDAGFMFGVIGNLGIGNAHVQYPTERWNGLYIDPTQIGFMDDYGGSFQLDATAFHEYAIRYDNDLISVYLDQPFESVVSGLSTPVLTRQLRSTFRVDSNRDGSQPVSDFFSPTNVENGIIQTSYEGVISFGDHTNSSIPPINSAYSLDYILFEELSARKDRLPPEYSYSTIPNPSSIDLISIGLLGIFIIQYNKKPVRRFD